MTSQGRIILGVIALVALAGAAVAYVQHAHALAIARAHYNQARDAASRQHRAGQVILNAYYATSDAIDSFNVHYTKAEHYSSERHNSATTSDDPDASQLLIWVKAEEQNVAAAGDDVRKFSSEADAMADRVSSLYGDQAANPVRDDAEHYVTDERIALEAWDRAASDIKDAIEEHINGGFGDASDSGREYDETEQYDTRADTDLKRFWRDGSRIESRLKSDGARLQREANALAVH